MAESPNSQFPARYIKTWRIPKWFLQEANSIQVKTADHKNINRRAVETRRLTLCGTLPWCQPIQELCMKWSYLLQPPPLTMLLEPLESWGLFDYEFQFSLLWMHSKYHEIPLPQPGVSRLAFTACVVDPSLIGNNAMFFLSSLACCPQNTQSHWASS